MIRNEKTRIQLWFFQSGTQTSNSCLSFDYTRLYCICLYNLCRSIEKYICVGEKAPILAANLVLQKFKKNWWTFLWHRTVVEFSSQNNFDNLGFFCKSFYSCRNHNSLKQLTIYLKLSAHCGNNSYALTTKK